MKIIASFSLALVQCGIAVAMPERTVDLRAVARVELDDACHGAFMPDSHDMVMFVVELLDGTGMDAAVAMLCLVCFFVYFCLCGLCLNIVAARGSLLLSLLSR